VLSEDENVGAPQYDEEKHHAGANPQYRAVDLRYVEDEKGS
jgi:hypothetical protein